MLSWYRTILIIFLVTILTACGGSGNSGSGDNPDSSRFHAFGHSLFTYTGGDAATPTPYTNVGDWLGLLAAASGNQSVGTFTFGQIDSYNMLDWSSASNVLVNGGYSIGNTSPFIGDFSDGAYTHFYLMPSNFLPGDMGPPPFNNSVANTQAGLETLIDNIDRYYPDSEKILYVHWPDGGSYTVSISNSRGDFTNYNSDVIGDYLNWHIALQNAVNANGRSIRVFPVGPVIAWLLENEAYLQSLNFYDVYGDSAPHGTENIYLLAALVVYLSVYEDSPNLSGFAIPAAATQIRPEIANNLPSIVTAIQTRLEFHDSNGVNVWP